MKISGHKLSLVTGATLLALFSSARTAEIEILLLGEQEVEFEIFTGGRGESGLLFVSLHSNEKTGISAIKGHLPEISGKYVGIQAGGDRRLHLAPGRSSVTIDPNRMFSRDGIERDLRRFSVPRPGDADLVETFSRSYLKQYISRAKTVVALHNNTPGGYSINSYRSGGSEAGSTGELHINPDRDPDNFFLVTANTHFEALKAQGYNVVLQSSTPMDDGSLSVYCGRARIPYINVETQSGNMIMNVQMLRSLLQILGQSIADPTAALPSNVSADGSGNAETSTPSSSSPSTMEKRQPRKVRPFRAVSNEEMEQVQELIVHAAELDPSDEVEIQNYGISLASRFESIGEDNASSLIIRLDPKKAKFLTLCIYNAVGEEGFGKFDYLRPFITP